MSRLCPYLFCLALCLAARGAEISIASQSVAAGASLAVPVVFHPQGSAVTGLQFDIDLDSAIGSLGVIASDARIHTALAGPNRRRVLVIDSTPAPLVDGTLINLFLNVGGGVATGEYPLRISNLIGTTARGDAVAISAAAGALRVTGDPSAPGPLQLSGVLNAASLQPGPIAPGEIITLIGSGLTPALTGAKVAVLFDGIAAAVVYAKADQINATVPADIPVQASTRLEILHDGQRIAEVAVPMAAAAPGLFTKDGTGAGPAMVLNQDLTLNASDHPAGPGSTVRLFATGAGQMQAADLQVQFGALLAQVISAVPWESVPGLVALEAAVPAGVESGDSVPLLLIGGGVSSQSGVTISIR